MADSLFSLISSEGKRENLYPVIPKQDFRTYDALQVQLYRTAWELPLAGRPQLLWRRLFFGLYSH